VASSEQSAFGQAPHRSFASEGCGGRSPAPSTLQIPNQIGVQRPVGGLACGWRNQASKSRIHVLALAQSRSSLATVAGSPHPPVGTPQSRTHLG
jgi:hypothetical protein